MKGYPKILKTKEDYYNCLALVQTGELAAAGLAAALAALEKRRYIECKVISASDDRKSLKVMYCAEALKGSKFISGAATGTLAAVTHTLSNSTDTPSTTALTLTAAVPEGAESISIMNTNDVLAAMGMTESDLTAIKGVLAQYE
jgi:hypothetical protein